MKKVTFGSAVIIFIPKEDRSGAHWVLDRLRFEQRVKHLEELLQKL